MQRIVELKEREYVDKDQFDDAPVNYDDAIENYKRLLDITGDVAANILEPNSESVGLAPLRLLRQRQRGGQRGLHLVPRQLHACVVFQVPVES